MIDRESYNAFRGILNSLLLGAVFWLAFFGAFLLVVEHC